MTYQGQGISPETWAEINYYLELIKQEGDAGLLTCLESLIREVTETEGLAGELREARETIKRLNRRVQSAESGVLDNLIQCRRAGVSFGRALANSAATMYESQLRACATALREAVRRISEHGSSIPDDLDRWTAVLMESERRLFPDRAPKPQPPLNHPDAR